LPCYLVKSPPGLFSFISCACTAAPIAAPRACASVLFPATEELYASSFTVTIFVVLSPPPISVLGSIVPDVRGTKSSG